MARVGSVGLCRRRDAFRRWRHDFVPGLRRRRLMPQTAAGAVPHVVIVGAGFGGLEVARRLARAPVRVTVIDRHNYHLVPAAALPGRDRRAVAGRDRSADPRPCCGTSGTRGAARRSDRRGHNGAPFETDWRRPELRLPGAGDRLAIRLFRPSEWPRLAPGLKSIDDATSIRRRLLLAFEEAESVSDRRSAGGF